MKVKIKTSHGGKLKSKTTLRLCGSMLLFLGTVCSGEVMKSAKGGDSNGPIMELKFRSVKMSRAVCKICCNAYGPPHDWSLCADYFI